jgi:hypothetical protein
MNIKEAEKEQSGAFGSFRGCSLLFLSGVFAKWRSYITGTG